VDSTLSESKRYSDLIANFAATVQIVEKQKSELTPIKTPINVLINVPESRLVREAIFPIFEAGHTGARRGPEVICSITRPGPVHPLKLQAAPVRNQQPLLGFSKRYAATDFFPR
jgi:hypothetical protein